MDLSVNQCAAQSLGPVNQLFALLIQSLLTAKCNISPETMWPRDYGMTAIEKGLDDYDFVVIGAGSAGSVVATRLSENPDWKVLLLEAGGNPPMESEVPIMFMSNLHSRTDWQFETEPQKACLNHKRGCLWSRGKMLGGSHSMNAMFYIRGNDRDYDRWEELGNPTWNFETALRYFKRSEANQNESFVMYRNGRYHSDKGKLIVGAYGKPLPFGDIYIGAGKEQGYEYIEDINRDQLLGYVHVQGTVLNARRQSVAKTFLIPAKDRPNLHIIKHAHVTRILFDGVEAVGVEFIYNGTQLMTAHSRKEVVLSAGSISSPPLLMLSGIGPRDHLEKFGIPVKIDAAVGKNLQDHIMVKLFFEFHRSSAQQDSPLDMLDNIYNFAIHNSGPLSGFGVSDLVAFVNSQNGTGYPDVQLHFLSYTRNSPLLTAYLDLHEKLDDRTVNALIEVNKRSEVGVIYVVLLNPKSVGRIELRSNLSTDPPKIFANYFEDDEDMATMLRGVKQQVAMTETETFREHEGELVHIPIPECDSLDFKSDEYFRCYIQHMSGTLYHPVGTSKMGPCTDTEAVVDDRLRVKGVKKLRQVDAGIMPQLVSGNTNAATIMIAERGVNFIKEEWNAPTEN